jgi:aminoglycoside 6'-N-acetyltransferase I
MSDASVLGGSIVPCTAPEQPGWLALRLQLWPHQSAESLLPEMAAFCASPERFGQFLFLSSKTVAEGLVEVALRSDYVNGTSSSPVAFLEGIFVTPENRRQGIARALVGVAEAWARKRGCQQFASDALLENQDSHAMHLALGFEE